jgi:hypothetical protein
MAADAERAGAGRGAAVVPEGRAYGEGGSGWRRHRYDRDMAQKPGVRETVRRQEPLRISGDRGGRSVPFRAAR